jgi:hypothetical protein
MDKEKIKKLAAGGSAIALAIAMALQTFVFGQNDIEALKQEVTKISERLTKLEVLSSLE